jgi:hypothetical protein
MNITDNFGIQVEQYFHYISESTSQNSHKTLKQIISKHNINYHPLKHVIDSISFYIQL